MLGTFRKHSTWLWGIIIAAMAVSLIFWTGQRGNQGGDGGTIKLGSIAGKAISLDDYQAAGREVKLEYRFSRGEWPGANADLEAEIYKRLFIIQKQAEMGIHVSPADVARVAARELQALAKNAGGPVSMEVFEKRVLAEGGLTLGDYERFLRHSLGIQQMVAATGVSGKLVTPQEARAIYERENQDISAQVVFFDASNYLAGVTVTPAALTEFYTNQMARYRLPDRVQVSYVEFKATNFWAAVGVDLARLTNQPAMAELVTKYGMHPSLGSLPNLDALLDAEYKRKTNFYAGITPEKAKESIRVEIQHSFALALARKQASTFVNPLVSAKEIKAESLTELAQKQGLAVKETTPFDRSQGPGELNVAEAFVRAAFALRPEEPIAGPLLGDDAAYVIARNKQLPSENPPFEAVKARVESDYKFAQAVQAACAAGAAFAQSATTGLAQSNAFTSVCAAAKVTPVLLPPFSRSTRSLPEVENHITLQQFKDVAFNTTVGQSSQFVPVRDGGAVVGGVVVYVQAKMPPDEAKTVKELPEFTTYLRQARQSEAFQEWFGREAQAALADTPAFRPRPSQMNQSRRAN